LKKGVDVVTQGGIIGTIVNVNQNTFDLKINDETKIRVLKSAVTDVWTEQSEAKDISTGSPS
jgi:preprotein translocase YajC subunit